MKNVISVIVSGIFAMTISACSESEQESERKLELATVVEEKTGGDKARPLSDATPCEILDDELIHAHFDVASDAVISRASSKYSAHPVCNAHWPTPDADEFEKKSSEAMPEYLRRIAQGEDVAMPTFRTTDDVSLTLHARDFDSVDHASAAFDDIMRTLSEGMTAGQKDREVTFQADLTAVDDIGDKAMWAAKMRQLSVLDDKQIFHVTVNTGAETDAELARAKAIAGDVMRELRGQ